MHDARGQEGPRRRLIRQTRYIARQYADDPVVAKFMGKLDRAAGDLFVFVLDPRIPPTNNIAERGLREIVVHRKIRGAIRAAETMSGWATCSPASRRGRRRARTTGRSS